ncbi:MAG TPA: hypothetical protein VGH27_32855 [Streptosporangiaceae bacterium]|jgi:hypothetical protein
MMAEGAQGNGGKDRISQGVTDISDSGQLISYATAGQLAWLQERHPDASQARVAHAAGMGGTPAYAGANLSTALRKHTLTPAQLQKLDEIIGALAPDMDGTGGLCSLALRLSAEPRGRARSNNLITYVPSSWTGRILREPPGGEAGVLLQASALLCAFRATDKMQADSPSGARLRREYAQEIDALVHRLIMISIGPPTSRNYDAQILLGMLASYAFDDQMRGHLDAELRESPLGFRVWRAITKLVMLDAGSRHSRSLEFWVRDLLRNAEALRASSIYPGRGLDLELAITVPATWSPATGHAATEALFKRAGNPAATIRERGTAVMGIWHRAVDLTSAERADIRTRLYELADQLRDPAARPDAAAGMRWVADTLQFVLDQRISVCNEWPPCDELWFGNVQAAADELDECDLPDRLRPGAKNLFRHMLLQNAGVYRRQAIETVVTSCWTEPLVKALRYLLEIEKDESWLRIRALFALSFLQRPDLVEGDLVRGCQDAYANLGLGDDMNQEPPRTRITEMHAALFAVGDCFGVPGAQDRAQRVREELRPIVTSLVTMPVPRAAILHRAVRAAAYLLVFTAQPAEGGAKDLSQELLEQLRSHPDREVASLSRWALSSLFAPDGSMTPLLDVPRRSGRSVQS